MRYLLALTGIIMQALFIITEQKGKMGTAVLLKGTAALIFVLIGYLSGSDNYYVFYGLLCGATGDILLALRYIAGKYRNPVYITGIIIFTLGHLFYLMALYPFNKHILLCVIASLILSALILGFVIKKAEKDKKVLFFGIVYLVIISLMVTFSVTNYLDYKSKAFGLFALGAILFITSDIIKTINTYERNPLKRTINLSLYYLGQLFIALSLC